ncbi:MAG: patatin-like phospholipase family protein, partial [Thermodesulfobacteriota bacterium]|nr:patatin-like phospholipase family protein [Thermodesulfobacteriota bacterium]
NQDRFIVPILAGGGTRLPAHVGAMAALNRLGVGFNHIVGVSGGGIVAALVAAGKNTEEIKQLALNVDFKQFRGYSLYQLIFHGGLSSGIQLEKWLYRQIGDIKFSDLSIGLHIVATDVRTGRPVIFNKELTPTLNVVEAVRCSMGIPLLFTFKDHGGKIIVDGSILAEDVLRKNWSGDHSPVCFFRIRSNGLTVKETQKAPTLPRFVAMVIRTFMTTISREYIHDAHWNSTIIINSEDVSPVEFSLTKEDKEKLYGHGFDTTMKYFPEKFLRHQP